MWTNLLYVMLGSAVGGGCRFLVSKIVTEHILGCYKGIVKEVIKISSSFTSEEEYPGRKVFEGEELDDSPYLGMDIRDIFDTLANFRIKYYNM